ncbi:hypothetical protein GCM10009593_38530 [Microlunatus antarcticus]
MASVPVGLKNGDSLRQFHGWVVPPESDPLWPVDLDDVRLPPMEGEDGPLLQELFDDLADFCTHFGVPQSADAVSTFLALPEGRDYDSKLLLGIGSTVIWQVPSTASRAIQRSRNRPSASSWLPTGAGASRDPSLTDWEPPPPTMAQPRFKM